MTNRTDNSDYDAGDRRHVQRRRKASKVRERQLAEAFKWLMGDARGRMLMWERLGEAGIFRSSMAERPELTAFREGRRDLGLRDLGQIMRLCPEQSNETSETPAATSAAPEQAMTPSPEVATPPPAASEQALLSAVRDRRRRRA
jgi:hypothetical protein